MNIEEIPITQIIPQRKPFLMVDKVISCGSTDTITQFQVREDLIFLEDNKLSPPGILENMAQSAAARMGSLDLISGVPVKIGYIGDIRDVTFYRLPKCNEVLETQVHIVERLLNLMLAQVSVRIADELIASARIKLVKTDIEAKLDNVEF